MCRLLGWSAPRGTTPIEAADGVADRLRELSLLHEDGWGVAWYHEGTVQRVREVGPAHRSAAFDTALTENVSDVGLIHLRWATDQIPTRLSNTHPFVHGNVAFAHNGALRRGPALDALIDADLLGTAEGETDSERYLLALISARRRTGSIPEAVLKLLTELEDDAWSSLNFVMTEPGHLYALCHYVADRRPAGTDPDYFQMHFAVQEDRTTVWSSGVRDCTGSELPNGYLLIADTANGEVRLLPV